MPVIDNTTFDFAKIGNQTFTPNNLSSNPNNTAGGFDFSQFGSRTGGTGATSTLLDPANARRAISGLLPGGTFGQGRNEPNIGFADATSAGAAATGPEDWRVRVSLAPGCRILYQSPTLFPDSILHPLTQTNGVIWPYTPTVNVTHNANYSTAQLTHSNYPAHFYNNSEVADININGDFTVQNVQDGQYLMAAIYFFRSVTKMFFGQGDNVGNPPPLVFLDGYGSHYFPHVPCVVTSFTHNMGGDVDYVEIPVTVTTIQESFSRGAPGVSTINTLTQDADGRTGAGDIIGSGTTTFFGGPQTERNTMALTSTSRVPTFSSISVTLRPIYSRKNIYDRFDHAKFADGALLQDFDKGYGGFI